MSLEDIELENVERIERIMTQKHGELSAQLVRSINNIKNNLKLYEVGNSTLDMINNIMHEASEMDNIKQSESVIKKLSDTFWD